MEHEKMDGHGPSGVEHTTMNMVNTRNAICNFNSACVVEVDNTVRWCQNCPNSLMQSTKMLRWCASTMQRARETEWEVVEQIISDYGLNEYGEVDYYGFSSDAFEDEYQAITSLHVPSPPLKITYFSEI